MSECGKLEVTFHKAFDETPSLLEALETLNTQKGIISVLTQGGKTPIMQNL